MSRPLPARPSLENLRNQAKSLLRAYRANDPEALARFRNHPRSPSETLFTLADAQLVVARDYGFASWPALKAHIDSLRPDSVTEATVRELQTAAGRGDLARMTELLNSRPELINETGGPGVRTALHHAVFGKSEAAARFLLERGANPNIRCEGDNAYPLHFACEKQLFPIIRLLVEHGADLIGEGDYHELGVLGWATAWESIPANTEIVDYLLALGGRHNIFSAVSVGNLDAIREIAHRSPGELERRMDVANRRRRPLHLAVVKRQPRALVALLDLGANPESLDVSNFTALDQAALLNQTDTAQSAMVQIILDRGVHIRLPAAIALNRTADMQRILARDPDALKPGNRWEHLIVRAAEHSSGVVIDALMNAGASVNVSDNTITAIDLASGFTPLHAAAWNGNLSAVSALMRHGANVRAREGKWHGTPAGWADYAGHKDVRDLILTGPVDIIEAIQYGLTERIPAILHEDPGALNRTFEHYGLYPLNAEGWYSPLVYAIKQNNPGIVRLLLDLGADTTVRTPDGQTLSELGEKAGNHEIVTALRGAQGSAQSR